MTQGDLFPTATSSPQDTPASPSVSPESKKARQMIATSGRTSAELLHKSDPLGAFSKMFMATSHWGSTKCSLTWKPKATPAGRLLFQLAVSMPRTEETDSGLLHTPTAKGNQMAPSMLEKGSGWWATPRTTDATGGPRKLDERGRRISQSNPNLVFGANLADQVKMWPTPRASEYKDTGPVGSKSHTHMKDRHYLCAEGKDPEKPTGQLNPQWVEWLMGYPEGWTDLKD